VLVAHAAAIELGFLAQVHALRRSLRVRRAIDVLDLAAELAVRSDDETTTLTWRLPNLAEAHGVPVARTHHALGAAMTTAQLFLVPATRLEVLGAGRVSDLLGARRPQFA
jgi:DNA polymerase III epsilon subunit-like protein